MRVLVTGGAGFVGFHVASRLLAAGHDVLVADSMNDYYDVNLKRARLQRLMVGDGGARLEVAETDLATQGQAELLVRSFRANTIVHLAAQAGVRYSVDHPREYTKSNVVAFLEVLEAARHGRVGHLVYASSSSVYGSSSPIPFVETQRADEPVSLYAATKRSGELMAWSYSHLYGIPATALRFFTVYGPWGRPDMAYWSFTEAIREGRRIKLFNHGAQMRDFTYIDEVADAVTSTLFLPPSSADGVPHRTVNLGHNSPIELSRFVRAIESAVGRRAVVEPVEAQSGDVARTYASIDRAHELVGFTPQVEIEVGIERFVRWYEDEWNPQG